ncbi:MAG: hypothetical protein JNK38_28295 [Acidobacteria bacterium]|nr:hypothetical protein [Acidobacteriota bacterium]
MKLFNRTNEDSPEVEAFVASAQRHFASAFPNPQREGCPALGVIQTVVRSEQLPDDMLQAHLFGCSECFNEYQIAVRTWQVEKERTVDVASGWLSGLAVLWNWRTLAGATVIALLLLSVGLWFWRASAPQSNQVRSQPTPTASVVAESIQPGPVGTTSSALSEAERQPPGKENLLAIKIDLNEFRSLGSQRRGSSEAESPITLPRARRRLLLTLRENSPAGSYRISLFEAGRKRDAVIARSRNGRTLQVVLDLRRVVGTEARLSIGRISQPDFAPDEYSLVIKRP